MVLPWRRRAISPPRAPNFPPRAPSANNIPTPSSADRSPRTGPTPPLSVTSPVLEEWDIIDDYFHDSTTACAARESSPTPELHPRPHHVPQNHRENPSRTSPPPPEEWDVIDDFQDSSPAANTTLESSPGPESRRVPYRIPQHRRENPPRTLLEGNNGARPSHTAKPSTLNSSPRPRVNATLAPIPEEDSENSTIFETPLRRPNILSPSPSPAHPRTPEAVIRYRPLAAPDLQNELWYLLGAHFKIAPFACQAVNARPRWPLISLVYIDNNPETPCGEGTLMVSYREGSEGRMKFLLKAEFEVLEKFVETGNIKPLHTSEIVQGQILQAVFPKRLAVLLDVPVADLH